MGGNNAETKARLQSDYVLIGRIRNYFVGEEADELTHGLAGHEISNSCK